MANNFLDFDGLSFYHENLNAQIKDMVKDMLFESILTLDRIYITEQPKKTAYYAYDVFDPSGMVVKADYSLNGADFMKGREVTGYTYPTTGLTTETTKITISLTVGGITRTTDVAVNVSKKPVTVPTFSQSIFYNATVQTPEFDNDPGSIATKSQNVSGLNADNYTIRFTLNDPDNYVWADGGPDIYRDVAWSIKQATPTFSVDPNSVILDEDTLTKDCTISTNSTGNITPSTNDDKIATCNVSGSTATVSNVDRTKGYATITLTLSETQNYKGATCEISVTADFAVIYGVSWDGSASSALERTDSAVSFVDPVPYVEGESNHSSPFDEISPWKDMDRVTDDEAGVMVKIPKFWYKLTQIGEHGVKIQISDKAISDFSVCPACMDRDDGNGERDYILVGRYHCAVDTYKSSTNVKPQVNVSQADFRTRIHELGSDVYMMDFATRFTIWLLYIVEFANWNSQSTIGRGCGNRTSSNQVKTENMGYTDYMPYHTGTTQNSRDVYGLGIQYRYLEGLWDNCYDRLTGCYNSSDGMMVEINPSEFSENSGGTSVGTPVDGFIAGLKVSTSGPFPCFINSSTDGGSSTSYIGDYWAFNESEPVVICGGYYDQYSARGMFCIQHTILADISEDRGSRLMKLPQNN